MSVQLVVLVIVGAVLIAIVSYYFGKSHSEVAHEKWKESEVPKIRTHAVRGSRNAIMGQATEQLAPFLPGFGYAPKDARFIGQPVDYIVFDGLSEGAVRQVVFVEIKAGGRLNHNQRQVRDAINAQSVKWETYEIGIGSSPPGSVPAVSRPTRVGTTVFDDDNPDT